VDSQARAAWLPFSQGGAAMLLERLGRLIVDFWIVIAFGIVAAVLL
jgi:hypothetical protein